MKLKSNAYLDEEDSERLRYEADLTLQCLVRSSVWQQTKSLNLKEEEKINSRLKVPM